MKKKYQIILSALLLILGILVLIYGQPIWDYFDITTLEIWAIVLNIFVYVGRTITIRITKFVFKTSVLRFIIQTVINLIWVIFLFWLLSIFAPTVFVAISSFIVVAVSLTFRDRINNITSGILILVSETFQVGDFIETNNYQGIVREISLNYTEIRGINGVISYLPNSNMYNASVKKFTQKQMKDINIEKEGETRLQLKEYVSKFGEIISKGERLTRFIKTVEILSYIDPDELKNRLSSIFNQYEKVFGYKPFYYINYTNKDRCNITLQIVSKNPKLILYYYSSFLRDVLFTLFPEKIFDGWEGNRRNLVEDITMEEMER